LGKWTGGRGDKGTGGQGDKGAGGLFGQFFQFEDGFPVPGGGLYIQFFFEKTIAQFCIAITIGAKKINCFPGEWLYMFPFMLGF
jgi:hypothetical protein